MKPSRLFSTLGVMLALLVACGKEAPKEQNTAETEGPSEETPPKDPPAPAGSATKSEHYDAVVSHLDVGGVFFGYLDVAGDLDRFLGMVQEFVDVPAEEEFDPDGPGLQLKDIADELGLTGVAAMGGSSLPTEPDRFRNQSFICTPGGPKGIFTLFGGEAKPLAALEIAPAGSDYVVEQEFRLEALKDIALGIFEKLPAELAQGMNVASPEELLQEEIPPLGMSIEEILDKANGRALFVLRFHPEEELLLTDLDLGLEGMTIPAFDFLLELRGLGWIYEKIDAVMPPFVPREEGEGYARVSLPIPLFPLLLLYHDIANDRVLLASGPEFFEACQPGNGEKLGADPGFQKIFQGLPVEGSSLTYTSPRLMKIVGDVVEDILERQDFPLGPFGEMITGFLSRFGSAASVTVYRPNGIHKVGNASTSLKSSIANLAALPVAAGLLGFNRLSQLEANVMAMPPDQPWPPGDIPPAIPGGLGPVEVEPAGDGMTGLEQTIAALRLYALDKNGQFPASLADLTPGYVDEEAAETIFVWPRPGDEPAPLAYFSGFTVASKDNPIILAAPLPDRDGKRAVAYINGITAKLSEDEYARALAAQTK